MGHAIAQVISPKLLTVLAWFKSQVTPCVLCGRQSGTLARFLQALWFPLPIFIPPTAPHSPLDPSLTLYSLYTVSTTRYQNLLSRAVENEQSLYRAILI
jgi:hypothetical protein